MPGPRCGVVREGMAVDLMHKLRALDYEVEQMRVALAALQQHLAARHAAAVGPAVAEARSVPPPAAAPAGGEWLRAYV
jgi:hypothetical protein